MLAALSRDAVSCDVVSEACRFIRLSCKETKFFSCHENVLTRQHVCCLVVVSFAILRAVTRPKSNFTPETAPDLGCETHTLPAAI